MRCKMHCYLDSRRADDQFQLAGLLLLRRRDSAEAGDGAGGAAAGAGAVDWLLLLVPMLVVLVQAHSVNQKGGRSERGRRVGMISPQRTLMVRWAAT